MCMSTFGGILLFAFQNIYRRVVLPRPHPNPSHRNFPHAVQCHAMPCNAMQCNALQCKARHCIALHRTALSIIHVYCCTDLFSECVRHCWRQVCWEPPPGGILFFVHRKIANQDVGMQRATKTNIGGPRDTWNP